MAARVGAPPNALGSEAPRRFGCLTCGADLEYAAGSFAMKCPYCGNETSIPAEARGPVVEHAIAELDRLPALAPGYYAPALKEITCAQCGASAQVPIERTALDCPFCGADVVVASGPSRALLKPESLIPFGFDRAIALQKFQAWISRGFFRPG